MFSYIRKPKFAFFGTPRFAATILEKLIEANMPPKLLVCNPDRPVGRKKILTPPPTKFIAIHHNIPVFQPENFHMKDFLSPSADIDFFVIAAYSKILPKQILD